MNSDLFPCYTTEEHKCGHKVDLYYFIKVALFMLATLYCTPKWERFEILVALLAKSQSQQKIMLGSFSFSIKSATPKLTRNCKSSNQPMNLKGNPLLSVLISLTL